MGRPNKERRKTTAPFRKKRKGNIAICNMARRAMRAQNIIAMDSSSPSTLVEVHSLPSSSSPESMPTQDSLVHTIAGPTTSEAEDKKSKPLMDVVIKTEEDRPETPQQEEEFEMHRNRPTESPPLNLKAEPSSSELQQASNITNMVPNNIRLSDEYSAFGDVVGHKIRKLRTENLRNLAQLQITDILYELSMSSENGQEDSAWSSTSGVPEVVDVKIEVEDNDLLGNGEK